MSAPQKTLLKDVLLMSENEDAPPQETNRSKGESSFVFYLIVPS